MSTTEEESRHDLIEALRAAIGHQQTGTLMGYLPPVGWADVATKQDLAHQDALLRVEIGAFRTEMRAEMDGLRADMGVLRADMGVLRADMTAEIGVLRTETNAGMNSLESRLEARMQEMFRKQTITLMSLMTALMTAFVAATTLL